MDLWILHWENCARDRFERHDRRGKITGLEGSLILNEKELEIKNPDNKGVRAVVAAFFYTVSPHRGSGT
jgi:hypothetical protein